MTTLAVLNPWQGSFAATLASIKPDRDLFMLEWSPSPGSSHIALGKLSSLVEENIEYFHQYLPYSLPAMLSELEASQDAARRELLEPINFIARAQPETVLVMADILPMDSFWKALPKDVRVDVLNISSRSDYIKEQCEKIQNLQKLSPRLHFSETPLDIIPRAWESLHSKPFDWNRGLLIAGPNAAHILTGLALAFDMQVPMIPGLMVGPGSREYPDVALTTLTPEGRADRILQTYTVVRRAALTSTPKFQCVVKESDSLAYVLAVKRCLERGGEVVLMPGPSNEARRQSDDLIRELSSEKLFQRSTAKVSTLKALATQSMPNEVHIAVTERSGIPIEVIGDPFPYSLCAGKDGKCWGETRQISFLPQDILPQLLQREFRPEKEDHQQRGPLCLVLDTLSPTHETEAQEIVESLDKAGACSLLVQGVDAHERLLHTLLSFLPFELVYFIAHGTENALVLRNRELTSFRARALDMHPHPLIINNSCLSWMGVGSSFVKGSAKAFIGTYWTVENDAAARIGASIVDRLLTGSTASEALLDSVRCCGDQENGFAYILVGPHDVRLQHSKRITSPEDAGYWYAYILRSLAGRQIEEHSSRLEELLRILEAQKKPNYSDLPSSLVTFIRRIEFDISVRMAIEGLQQNLDSLIDMGREVVCTEGADFHARTASHLGLALMSRGTKKDLLEAEEYFLRALEEWRRLGLQGEQAKELGNLGTLEMQLGNFPKASEFHEQALILNKALGNSLDLIIDLQNLALCNARLDVSKALSYAEQALNFHVLIKDFRHSRLRWCLRLAEVLLEKEFIAEAQQFLQRVFAVLQRTGSTDSEALKELHPFLIRAHILNAKILILTGNYYPGMEILKGVAAMALKAQEPRGYFEPTLTRLAVLAELGEKSTCEEGVEEAFAVLHLCRDELEADFVDWVKVRLNALLTG